MNRWINKWDGSIDGWMKDQWINERIDRWINGWYKRSMNKSYDREIIW